MNKSYLQIIFKGQSTIASTQSLSILTSQANLWQIHILDSTYFHFSAADIHEMQ
jgi:hypothetical protein